MNGYNLNSDPFGYNGSSATPHYSNGNGKAVDSSAPQSRAGFNPQAPMGLNHGVGAYGNAHNSYLQQQAQQPGIPTQYYHDQMQGRFNYGTVSSPSGAGECNNGSTPGRSIQRINNNGTSNDYASNYTIQQPLDHSQGATDRASYHPSHHVNSTYHRISQHQQHQQASSTSIGDSNQILAAARALCSTPPQQLDTFSSQIFDITSEDDKDVGHSGFQRQNHEQHSNEASQVTQNMTQLNSNENQYGHARHSSRQDFTSNSLKRSSTSDEQRKSFFDTFTFDDDDDKQTKRQKLDKHENSFNAHSIEESNNNNILSNFKMTISSLSLEPMTGEQVVTRVCQKSKEVITLYLPCVDLLVACQQDLRTGLSLANQRGRNRMSSSQFYQRFLEPLPRQFYEDYKNLMPMEKLQKAHAGIQQLLVDAKNERTGKCEGMKNAFLGGMRDGESWGLRKWLSNNGGALQICNDLELILGAMRKLPKAHKTTKLLAAKIQPEAKQAFDKLKKDIPVAYQEVSSAHPYLPFFHRLESALKGLHEFDPNDDDVICLDDSSDEEVEVINTKRGASSLIGTQPQENRAQDQDVGRQGLMDSPTLFQGLLEYAQSPDEHSTDGDDNDSVEICDKLTKNNGYEFDNDSLSPAPADEKTETSADNGVFIDWDQRLNSTSGPEELVGNLEKVVSALEAGQDIRPLSARNYNDFWSNPTSNFIIILRIFQNLMNQPVSRQFLFPINLEEYYSLVKHPICFRDIVAALSEEDDHKKGELECETLKKWNMFEGSKLIQAVDLVFLNVLAFLRENPAEGRRDIMRLRNSFWDEIRQHASHEKSNIPTKRAETSSFVVQKKR